VLDFGEAPVELLGPLGAVNHLVLGHPIALIGSIHRKLIPRKR
jgi:hypothetical protein